MKKYSPKNRGLSLVEVVIASAIVLMLSLALVSANLAYYKSSNANLKAVKAIYLVEEGIETVAYQSVNDWNILNTLTNDVIDGIYYRTFTVASVLRDSSSKDIVTSGGSVDTDTKKLTVSVAWRDANGTTTKSLSTYLMKNND